MVMSLWPHFFGPPCTSLLPRWVSDRVRVRRCVETQGGKTTGKKKSMKSRHHWLSKRNPPGSSEWSRRPEFYRTEQWPAKAGRTDVAGRWDILDNGCGGERVNKRAPAARQTDSNWSSREPRACLRRGWLHIDSEPDLRPRGLPRRRLSATTSPISRTSAPTPLSPGTNPNPTLNSNPDTVPRYRKTSPNRGSRSDRRVATEMDMGWVHPWVGLLSLIHIWRCRRSTLCRSRWSPYH